MLVHQRASLFGENPPNFQTMLCSSGLETTLQKVSLGEPGSSCPGQSSGDCRRAGESRSDLADALTSYVCQEPNLGDTSLLHWSFKNKEDDEQPCVLWVPYFERKPQTTLGIHSFPETDVSPVGTCSLRCCGMLQIVACNIQYSDCYWLSHSTSLWTF